MFRQSAPVRKASNDDYVTIDVLLDLLPSQGVTESRVYGAVRSGRIESKTGEKAPGGLRRLIHVGSARSYFAQVRDAIRQKRTTKEACEWNGKQMLPALLLAKEPYNWDHAALWRMAAAGHLTSKKLLAFGTLGDFDSLRWTAFYPEKQVQEALAAAKDRPAKSSTGGYQRKPVKQPGKDEMSTAEAMDLLGLNAPAYLYYLEAVGFSAPNGKRIKIKSRQRRGRRVNGWAGTLAFWRPRRDIDLIAKYRAAKRRDDPDEVYKPFKDHNGIERLRDRAVFHLFKVNGLKPPADATWAAWHGNPAKGKTSGCPALGGEIIDRIMTPSIRSTRPTEGACLKSQINAIIAALKKSPREYDKADFAVIEGRRFLPQHYALKYVPYAVLRGERLRPEDKRTIKIEQAKLPYRPNRDGWDKEQAVYDEDDLLKHPKAMLKKSMFEPLSSTVGGEAGEAILLPKARTKRGRKKVTATMAQHYRVIIEAWQRAKAADVKLEQFLGDYNGGEGLDPDEYKRARGWVYANSKN